MARATSSLPVPLSPLMSTVESACAAMRMRSNTEIIDARAREHALERLRLDAVGGEQLVVEIGRRVGGQRADQRQEAARLDGLGHVLDGAALERRDRRADRAVGGDEHRLGLGTHLMERLDERDAVAAGQLQIGEHQVERSWRTLLQRLFGIEGSRRLIALAIEQLHQRADQVGVVVDCQNLDRHLRPPGRAQSKRLATSASRECTLNILRF